MTKNTDSSELSRISFVFETSCSADCVLYFMAGYTERNNDVVEHWRGSREKQSYSYIVKSNETISFTWAFQRTEGYTTERRYSADYAKLYMVHVTNVIGGVASQCRHCALGSGSGCVPCPPGHYMLNGSGVCKRCPANTYALSACVSDCQLDLHHPGAEPSHYDFTPLANTTSFQSGPRFTSKGLRYYHSFSIGLCGNQGRALALCVDNVTESRREVRGHVCQATVVPSEVRGQSVVSSQPFSIGDALTGVTTESSLGHITSPAHYFPSQSSLPDVIFYYRSAEVTQACKNGRTTTIRLRCDPTVTEKDQLSLPSNCSEGTCDGCSFHFLWRSRHACPLCSESDYKEITSACIQGIQYKYSKLMMSSGEKECELPAADSCAIMEGEDAEDDLIYLTKKSIFGKIKAFSRERTSDGFDSVPLKSSSGLEMEMS
ncbi:hypothetical protein JZ751_015009 [Albula glossodonta]|uniref:MRH domain-containing protein n=1 Tax=Albula glossodonta TaxID=121402 RepID=A0A8T2MXQ4_9TELE|nr:hypothetical protein JZ751_015009 [Albula glossodonta]